ncbi:lipopolysaccharide biosynthesis protein [Streptomyces sp. NBC_01352]|uniref:lipopolysaccharide biosynthesis protein n=1 Tax=unclassified Streptomyces TaxID=2593676 RepID=UPI00224ED778|nr:MULTISPECIES: lipopolysaccharide biosynthesis protein [unclassified Streptomyces]MCX4697565.1 lipopolysaccharide biosynthesis protein [Streptomyces sp. NBC_01373]
MNDDIRGQQDEPELLRDQVQQVLRHRVLVAGGLLAGLLAGGWFGYGSVASYESSSEVLVRAATINPYATNGVSVDKQINIGSERQTAAGNAVAERAAEQLGRSADDAGDLQGRLQVTNPPDTLVLKFTYVAGTPKAAADGAAAFAEAYLDYRETQTTSTVSNMISGYKKQLDPLAEQREDLLDQIDQLQSDTEKGTALAAQANLLSQITELTNDISELKALDTTPGYVTVKAERPVKAEGLGMPMLIALGGVVGLALGLLGAWLRMIFDPAARSADTVSRALRAPVLGSLPRVPEEPLLAADGALAEQYRSVAFRLAYDRHFADRRRLLVVEPNGEGTTAAVVAVNLTACFAETGMSALLVEADLRHPDLARRLPAMPGARPGWVGREPADGTPWPGARHIAVDAGESGTFDLVPGVRVPHVARTLTSAATTRLIDQADAPNTTVVVLAPPVLSYADALALVDRVDGVVVVCDPRTVARTALERIRELIDGAGGQVLGAVLHQGGRQRKGRRRAQGPAPIPTAPLTAESVTRDSLSSGSR